MMPIKFLWHRLQQDLFENNSAAGCTNALEQERPSQTVAKLHAMYINAGKSMLSSISSTVEGLHCS